MANVTDTGPLDWRIPITDGQGRPSPEFQRRWNTNRNNSDLITAVNFGAGAPTTTGDPDGTTYFNVSNSPYTEYRSYGGVYYRVSPIGATPTATATTSPIPGSAGTFMRSDGAPALPIATPSVYGVVKPDGTTVTVSAGTISVPTATTSALGIVKPDGSTINVSAGAISVPTATTSNLGLVKPDGTTITVSGGVISSTGGGGGFSPAAACTATISGGAVSIQYATNVSSITYTGVGRYRINFSSALSNAYYGLAFAGRFPTAAGPVLPIINIDSISGYGQTTTHVDVGVTNTSGTPTDLAQLSVLVFNAGTAPSGSYLLDTLGVSASGAYSVRQLRSAATKSMNVRRDSDNTTMDIGFVSGALDTATLLSFVGSNGGWVTKWYDQSGNGNDLVQTNTNSQPQIVIAGVVQTNANGKNAIFFRNGYSTGMTNTASLLQAGAFTVSAAVQPNEVTSYPSFMGTPNPSYGDSVSFGVESATGNHYFALFCDGVGTANFTTPVNASASQILAVTSSAGVVTNTLTATGYVNNTSGGSATINTSASVVSGTSVGVPADTTAEQWQGYMSEIIIWPSVLSSGNLTTVYTSQHGAF